MAPNDGGTHACVPPNARIPGLNQVMGVINRGRYLEFALYAALALALAPLLHRAAEPIRKRIDAVVEGGQTEAAARSRWLMMNALAALVIGMLSGLFVQNYYGLGRILQTVGVPARANQTVTPASTSTPALIAPLAEIPQEVHGKMALFLLPGQSNMGGKGDLPQPSAPAHERIFVFGNAIGGTSRPTPWTILPDKWTGCLRIRGRVRDRRCLSPWSSQNEIRT